MSLLNVIAGEKRIDDIELRTITVVGYMGTGKTTLVRHLIARAYKHLKQNGIKDREILALHFYRANIRGIISYLRNNYDLQGLKYLYLINDDAAYTNISRRSSSGINVEDARQYIIIRHKLAELGFKGVLIVFHLTQLYYLLDKVLRDSHVLIFKSMSRDSTERKTLAMLLGRHYYKILKLITDKIMSGNKKELEEALSKAVVMIGTRKILYEFKKEDPPGSIYKEIGQQEIADALSIRFTVEEISTMLRSCGIRFDQKYVYDFVKMLNLGITRKLVGDFDLDEVISEILEKEVI